MTLGSVLSIALFAAAASIQVPGGFNATDEQRPRSNSTLVASRQRVATDLLSGYVPMWPWHYTTSSLIQEAKKQFTVKKQKMLEWSPRSCGPDGKGEWCQVENAHIAGLATFLTVAILTVLCIFSHIREDKEEQITPLCPQLIVKGNQPLRFRLVLDPSDEATEVHNADTDEFFCRVLTDSYDPLRPAFSGVAATVRLLDRVERTLATIVARSVAVQGQGICVCRAGCEIFGFVEPDEKREGRYCIRHRSDVNLLTLDGDWNSDVGNFKMVNPAGLTVFTMQKRGFQCEGEVHQGTDAGLMFCTLFAAHVKRQLLAKEMPSPWGPFASFPPSAQSPQFASLSAPYGSPPLQGPDPPRLASGLSDSSASSPAAPAATTAAAGGTGGTGRGRGKGGSAKDGADVPDEEAEEP